MSRMYTAQESYGNSATMQLLYLPVQRRKGVSCCSEYQVPPQEL